MADLESQQRIADGGRQIDVHKDGVAAMRGRHEGGVVGDEANVDFEGVGAEEAAGKLAQELHCPLRVLSRQCPLRLNVSCYHTCPGASCLLSQALMSLIVAKYSLLARWPFGSRFVLLS